MEKGLNQNLAHFILKCAFLYNFFELNNTKSKGEMIMNITSKELSWIEDQLSLEELMVKKYQMAAAVTSDTAIKSECEKIAKKHQGHFDKLYSYLN